MIEDDLKGLKLLAETSIPRDRILAAARESSRDSRIGRWIHRAAAAAVAMALIAVAIGEKEPPRNEQPVSAPGGHLQYAFPDESLEEDGPWRP